MKIIKLKNYFILYLKLYFLSINTLFINNYANTTSYKQIISKTGNGANGVSAVGNMWRSTAAVTTINLYTDGGYNFGAGTTFNLYGILAA